MTFGNTKFSELEVRLSVTYLEADLIKYMSGVFESLVCSKCAETG